MNGNSLGSGFDALLSVAHFFFAVDATLQSGILHSLLDPGEKGDCNYENYDAAPNNKHRCNSDVVLDIIRSRQTTKREHRITNSLYHFTEF